MVYVYIYIRLITISDCGRRERDWSVRKGEWRGGKGIVSEGERDQ